MLTRLTCLDWSRRVVSAELNRTASAPSLETVVAFLFRPYPPIGWFVLLAEDFITARGVSRRSWRPLSD